MIARIGKWMRDCRGVVAVEFAFAFPLMMLLTIGTMELALMMMLDASLEIGVAEASRTGSLTQSGSSAQREAELKRIVGLWVSRWVPGSSDITVQTFTYDNLTQIGRPTWIDANDDGSCQPNEGTCPPDGVQLHPGIGVSGSLTLYSVTVKRSGFTGILKLAGISELTFVRQAVVLNE